MANLKSSYAELYDEFQSLLSYPIVLKEPIPDSLFTICGYPSHENVWSNVYQYFLGKAKPPLRQLFLFALEECVTGYDLKMKSYVVRREVETQKGGRVDLVIHDEDGKSKAILIENKVYHTLENDLKDYYDSFFDYTERILIVLTLYPVTVDKKYADVKHINVKHIDWIKAVRKRLGAYVDRIDLKDLVFLQDFIQHVESFYEKPLDMDSFKFLYNYAEKIDALNKLQQAAKDQLQKMMLENLPSPWEQYRTAVNTIAGQRKDTCLVLYVTTDALFRAGDHHYNLQLWIRGESFIKKWATVGPLPEIDGIKPQVNSGGKEWVLIASKKYRLDLSGLENFGMLIRSHLEGEWRGFAESVLASLK